MVGAALSAHRTLSSTHPAPLSKWTRRVAAVLGAVLAVLIVAQVARGSTYSSKVSADAPFAWWRLDEASGSTAANSGTGSGLNGTYTGASYGQPGIDATDAAVGFNGTSTRVTATSSLLEPTGAFSVEAWFQTTLSSVGSRFLYRNNRAYGAMLLMDMGGGSGNVGKISFGFYDSAATLYSVTSPFKVNDGLWHQVVATSSGGSSGTIQLYIDGSLVATSTFSAPIAYAGATGIEIGSWTGTYFFPGKLDEFAFYNGVLSASHIAAHYGGVGLLGGLPVGATNGGPNAALPGLLKQCQCTSDPVNTENGDFFETGTDASVTTYGPPLAFTRTYDASLAQVQSTGGTPVEFPRFRGHLSAWPVWVGLEDGVHVEAKGVSAAVSGRVSS